MLTIQDKNFDRFTDEANFIGLLNAARVIRGPGGEPGFYPPHAGLASLSSSDKRLGHDFYKVWLFDRKSLPVGVDLETYAYSERNSLILQSPNSRLNRVNKWQSFIGRFFNIRDWALVQSLAQPNVDLLNEDFFYTSLFSIKEAALKAHLLKVDALDMMVHSYSLLETRLFDDYHPKLLIIRAELESRQKNSQVPRLNIYQIYFLPMQIFLSFAFVKSEQTKGTLSGPVPGFRFFLRANGFSLQAFQGELAALGFYLLDDKTST